MLPSSDAMLVEPIRLRYDGDSDDSRTRRKPGVEARDGTPMLRAESSPADVFDHAEHRFGADRSGSWTSPRLPARRKTGIEADRPLRTDIASALVRRRGVPYGGSESGTEGVKAAGMSRIVGG